MDDYDVILDVIRRRLQCYNLKPSSCDVMILPDLSLHPNLLVCRRWLFELNGKHKYMAYKQLLYDGPSNRSMVKRVGRQLDIIVRKSFET